MPTIRGLHVRCATPGGGAWGALRGHLARLCGIAAVALPAQLLGAAVACSPPEGFHALSSPDAQIAYRWEPERLEVGRFFAVEVIVCRTAGAREPEGVTVDALMPAHGHGMNYRPTSERLGGDRFRAAGLMLHMPGRGRFTFDILHGGGRTRLSRDVDVQP